MRSVYGSYAWLSVLIQWSFIEFQACARHCTGFWEVNKRSTVINIKEPTPLEETY